MRIVACALLALAAAGCGGGGPSREEFAAAANAVCTAADARVSALGSRPPLMTPAQAAWLERLLAIGREAVASLRALEPPSDGRRLVNAMLRAIERAIRHGERVTEAVRSRDAHGFGTESGRATDELGGASLAAAGYGLDACAHLARRLR